MIKLGGAALTDKTRIYTPRFKTLHSAARQLTAIKKRWSVILVHGAGSYGHIPVKTFGLSKGYHDQTQLRGLGETKFRLLEWEFTIDEVFLQHNVPIVPFVTSCYTVARRGRILSCDIDPIKTWIKLGCVPSTGGDIVSDVSAGFSIVSGDQLAAYLAIALKARMLIFATDVDGIFDADPKTRQSAHLIKEISVSSIRRISTDMGRTITDVTGGMKNKLEEAAAAAFNGIPVFFVNLLKGNRMQDLVLGRRAVCSELVRG